MSIRPMMMRTALGFPSMGANPAAPPIAAAAPAATPTPAAIPVPAPAPQENVPASVITAGGPPPGTPAATPAPTAAPIHASSLRDLFSQYLSGGGSRHDFRHEQRDMRRESRHGGGPSIGQPGFLDALRQRLGITTPAPAAAPTPAPTPATPAPVPPAPAPAAPLPPSSVTQLLQQYMPQLLGS